MQLLNMIERDDFLMFSTDYPHWDFDAPDRALPASIGAELRDKIMWQNAAGFYDLNLRSQKRE